MITTHILQLEAVTDGAIAAWNGAAVHGFFFKHLRNVNAPVAERLHADNNTPGPYSLSPLLGLPAPRGGLHTYRQAQVASLRITALSEDLAAAVTAPDGWLARLPERITLDGFTWRITGWQAAHPALRYEDLRDQALKRTPPPSRWRLIFDTPMTLSGRSAAFPFPLPESLLTGWIARWNSCAPFDIHPGLVDAARECMFIDFYDLRTVKWEGKRSAPPLTACTGEIAFRAPRADADLRTALDVLFAFSEFCGSGYKTSMGLGQTRVVRQT